MGNRLFDHLARLERISGSFGDALSARVDRIIREASRLARVIRLCPHCAVQMRRDGTMYTCPGCGMSRDDSDEPTAEFTPVSQDQPWPR